MARKVNQIVSRGERTWLVRVYLGRDCQTRKRNYHNRTIHGSCEKQRHTSPTGCGKRDLGRGKEGVRLTLNEYIVRVVTKGAIFAALGQSH
jgi:hypothetical protein